MMMKPRIMMAAAALCLSVTSSPFAADMSLRVNIPGNEQSLAFKSVEKFKAEFDKITDGTVELKLFPNSALGDQKSSLEAMQTGLLDMATIETPITTVVPELGAMALPYIFSGREHVKRAMDGATGKKITELLVQKGLRPIAFLEGGFRQITNNVRPIITPADLKGVKMRTPGSALRIKVFNHYGANASPLPFSELYSALQTKVFDGQENPVIWVKSQKFYEVQGYLSVTNHIYTITYLLMAEGKFQKLSQVQKDAMAKAADTAEAYSVELGSKADAELFDFLATKGMKVNKADVAAFVKESGEIWKDWAAEQSSAASELIELVNQARP